MVSLSGFQLVKKATGVLIDWSVSELLYVAALPAPNITSTLRGECCAVRGSDNTEHGLGHAGAAPAESGEHQGVHCLSDCPSGQHLVNTWQCWPDISSVTTGPGRLS